jgi:hypothetical protein
VALTKARLAKLEKVAVAKWEAEWEALGDTVRSFVPHSVFGFWSEMDNITEECRKATPEQLDKMIALQAKESNYLSDYLSLGNVWTEWVHALHEVDKAVDPDSPTPSLSHTPYSLPKPPHDPTEAIEKLAKLEWPHDPIGLQRFDYLWYLCIAKAVWQLHIRIEQGGKAK